MDHPGRVLYDRVCWHDKVADADKKHRFLRFGDQDVVVETL